MANFETNNTPSQDSLEARQDKFIETRKRMYEEEAKVGDPNLSQAEKDQARANLLRLAVENDRAFHADPRVVDKIVDVDKAVNDVFFAKKP